MADTDVQVHFGADTSDLKSGANEAKSLVQGLGADVAALKATLSGVGEAMRAAFQAPSLAGLTGAMGEAAGQAASMGRALAAAANPGAVTQSIASIGAVAEQTRQSYDQAIAAIQESEKERLTTRAAGHQQIVILAGQEAQAAIAAANAIMNAQIAADDAVLNSTTATAAQRMTALLDEVDAAATAEKARSDAAVHANTIIVQDAQRSARAMKSEWDRSVGSIVNDVGQGFLKVAQGGESWHKFAVHLLGQVEEKAVTSIDKMVSDWIYGEARKSAASAAGVVQRNATDQAGAAQARTVSFATVEKQIFNDALAAGAAAYKAMAGIPIIGPALGAGAAAVTFTAVEAFGQLASASGGFDIPAGVNPITQLHQNEMVLPASLANPLRGLLGDYGGGQGAPSAANDAGGDTHLHLHMGAGADGPSLQRWFDQHGDKIAKSLSTQTRRGAKFT